MQYQNVSVTEIRGRRHPALSNILITHEVQKSRIHIKMLEGDYFTYELNSIRSLKYTAYFDNLRSRYSDKRNSITEEYKKIWKISSSDFLIEEILSNNRTCCHFILDRASLNLQIRIPMSDFCHAVKCSAWFKTHPTII